MLHFLHVKWIGYMIHGMNTDTKKIPLAKRFFLHLHTVDTHRFLVMKYCFKCGLYAQGLRHDLSKYSLSEFIESVKFYQGDRSPYDYEKELYGYAGGWMHHKGRNKHHWEYWHDIVDGEYAPLKMPFNYLVELVCDRIAACRIYQKDKYTSASPLKYLMRGKDRYLIHPETAQQLISILQDISVRGEDAVCRDLKIQIRKWKKEQKKRKFRY